MKRITILLALTVMIGVTSSGFAGQFYGGKGFLHTNTALLLPPGALDFSVYTRAFVGTMDGNVITNGTSALASSFGFSRRMELGFTQITYQDLNETRKGADEATVLIPGNTYIRFKIAGYTIGDNIFWGVMPALHYRVAKYQDVHLEPYSSEGIEAELTGIFSYYVKPLYPDEAPSFHLNLGYINHNDGTDPGSAAQALNFLVSGLFPRPRYDYGFELYGSNFMKAPSDSALSKESWMYMTPFVRYKLFKGLHFTLGLDLLLMGGTDESYPKHDLNYPTYRIAGKINFSPSTAFYAAPTFAKASSASSGRERRTYSGGGGGGGESGGGSPMFSRQELFRWGIEERGSDIQNVDLDLEKLRQDRKKAEEELKALKVKLEERQKAEKK
jgi:uncharacterized membrane protein YgcG